MNEVLAADPCPKDDRSVILLPGIMWLQTHETIGHPLELDRILGYELAYAGGSFVTLDDFGSLRYGSPKLTARADATLPNTPGSFGFDDDGIPAQDNLLIDKGILVGAITGRQMVEEANARARKRIFDGSGGANRATAFYRVPIERMTNINIDPGEDGTVDDIVSQHRARHHSGWRQELVDRFQPRAVPLCHRHRLAGGRWTGHQSGQEQHLQRRYAQILQLALRRRRCIDLGSALCRQLRQGPAQPGHAAWARRAGVPLRQCENRRIAVKDRILQTLHELRAYALSKGVEAAFFYHEEDSHLMRFANSAISLNTNEHLIRLEITPSMASAAPAMR
jgi:hypothetical protein